MQTAFEKSVYEAFFVAGQKLGAKLKGLSCLLHNWEAPVKQVPVSETEKEAA